jgi:hypothetical protein
VPVGDERDLPPIRRPLRVDVMVVARRQALDLAAPDVDKPQAGEPLVDEPGAVELVLQRVDQARVRRRPPDRIRR